MRWSRSHHGACFSGFCLLSLAAHGAGHYASGFEVELNVIWMDEGEPAPALRPQLSGGHKRQNE